MPIPIVVRPRELSPELPKSGEMLTFCVPDDYPKGLVWQYVCVLPPAPPRCVVGTVGCAFDILQGFIIIHAKVGPFVIRYCNMS